MSATRTANVFSYSPLGLAMTKSFEGLRLTAYTDVAGVWTIGYGHTGPEVHAGLVWTQAEADAGLLFDMAEDVACVNRAVTVAITQNKFDALADFAFNAGRGAFLLSTLLRLLNAGDIAGAGAQFGLWVHAGGVVEPGLVRRRKAEATMFLFSN
jgi:lysozyme